jgi:predicted esterase
VHDLDSLDHRPADAGDRAVILLHGRHRPASEMREAAVEMGLLDSRCVFPVADDGSWYPHGFMEPLADNEPALGAAVDRIAREVERLAADGFDPDRIIVGGFSQGACVVCEYLRRRPPRHLGALILSGGLPGAGGEVGADRADLSGLPVLLTTSPADRWVPIARVRETAAWLEASGARVFLEVFADRPHRIDPLDIDACRRFLAGS